MNINISGRRRDQYAGFLAVILIVELTLAVSLYTYKDHLTSGLRKGLNQSLHNYGPSAVMQSADFDAMQENVSATSHSTFGCILLRGLNLHFL
jgi:hypothetical protein